MGNNSNLDPMSLRFGASFGISFCRKTTSDRPSTAEKYAHVHSRKRSTRTTEGPAGRICKGRRPAHLLTLINLLAVRFHPLHLLISSVHQSSIWRDFALSLSLLIGPRTSSFRRAQADAACRIRLGRVYRINQSNWS